jgi:hypothetical protein
MSCSKCWLFVLPAIIILSGCEEVIDIDLNSSDPAFVVEAVIKKDTVSIVRLTSTVSYFSQEKPDYVENASVTISDGDSSEELTYTGNGYYSGSKIIGTEEKKYEIEVVYNGILYKANSLMPVKTDLISVTYYKYESQSILNPYGDTVYTITCEFYDTPDRDNYYMIRFISKSKTQESSYYMLTEKSANDGSISIDLNGKITFSESLFWESADVDVILYSVDKSIYKYFLQLNDILFWKRRLNPPSPYNPESNITNGALGYFAAWAVDTERIRIE